jgi:hypothetical protein
VISRHLYTSDIPDPDLIIRTAGEMRLSNFLIWQAAYAEFYCTPTTWPDFDKESFYEALAEYSRRNRKFGGILPEELHEYSDDAHGSNGTYGHNSGVSSERTSKSSPPLDPAAVK